VRAYAWGQGPLVVLVHGWGGGAGQMAYGFVPALVERGFKVVAFDGPAHGASPGRRASIPEFGRALLAVAREYGPVRAVVGHSMGAAAIAFALSEGFAPEHVALIGPAADPGRWTAHFASRLRLTPEVMRRVRIRAERRLAFRWEDLPMARLLARCALPVLVVHDRDDREIPWREAASVAEAAPRGTLVTTRGLGHRRILHDPEVAAVVADFAAGRSLGERAGPPCGRRGCDETATAGGLCDGCALEADLFDPALRRLRASL
jgi:pimeloyl-ACP methyl ester carboxylesterase